MTKTTIQWLHKYLESKVLPCPEGNEYVYGMNVAHTNLIQYMIPFLLEMEKEQLENSWDAGFSEGLGDTHGVSDYNQEFMNYFNKTYKPETI